MHRDVYVMGNTEKNWCCNISGLSFAVIDVLHDRTIFLREHRQFCVSLYDKILTSGGTLTSSNLLNTF